MIKCFTKIACLGSFLLLAACVQKPALYDWGSYDKTLLAYYKDTSQLGHFEEELFSLINATENIDKPLPPGIYAEYAFLQLRKGNMQEAIHFFETEKNYWPESTLLMDTMIRLAGGQTEEPPMKEAPK